MPNAETALTATALQNATDAGRFTRGQKLVSHVRELVVSATKASARVGSRQTYPVTIDWSRPAPRGACMCVDFLEGWFYKHVVALGLAVIAAESATATPAADPIADLLESLDRAELITFVHQLAERDPTVLDLLRTRAVMAGRADAIDPDDLVRQVNDALRSRGFVDYRASFAVARDAEAVLDRLEGLLDAGAADAVAKALLRATTRLRAIPERADDSGGVIGSAGQRAVELYARACREGRPNPSSLARWLLKFRRDSPGWPDTPLELFAPAFDAKALAIYRRGVDDWAAALADQGASRRFGVHRALVELADQDHDLERVITLLSTEAEYIAWAEIIRRLRGADRIPEAVEWLDQAMAGRRLALATDYSANEYRVAPHDASELYQLVGRPDDALAVWQQAYAKGPTPDTWRSLLDFAATLGRQDEIRAWAVATAEEQAGRTNGAALISIYLAEDQLDEAWAVAETYGPGSAWSALVQASGPDRAIEVEGLFRDIIESLLPYAKLRTYQQIAILLTQMRKVSGGNRPAFDAYVADLKHRFARRPMFIGALRDKRL